MSIGFFIIGGWILILALGGIYVIAIDPLLRGIIYATARRKGEVSQLTVNDRGICRKHKDGSISITPNRVRFVYMIIVFAPVSLAFVGAALLAAVRVIQSGQLSGLLLTLQLMIPAIFFLALTLFCMAHLFTSIRIVPKTGIIRMKTWNSTKILNTSDVTDIRERTEDVHFTGGGRRRVKIGGRIHVGLKLKTEDGLLPLGYISGQHRLALVDIFEYWLREALNLE